MAEAGDFHGSFTEKLVNKYALKFGEPFKMATPSQASKEEGVETRQELPKVGNNQGEGIVQTTN